MPGESERYKPYRVDEEAGWHAAKEKAEKYGGTVERGSFTTGHSGEGFIRKAGGEGVRSAIRSDSAADYRAQIKGVHDVAPQPEPVASNQLHRQSVERNAVSEASPYSHDDETTEYLQAMGVEGAESVYWNRAGRSSLAKKEKTYRIIRQSGDSDYRTGSEEDFDDKARTYPSGNRERKISTRGREPHGRPISAQGNYSQQKNGRMRDREKAAGDSKQPQSDTLYRRLQQKKKDKKPHSLRLLARGAAVKELRDESGSDVSSKALAVTSQTPAMLRQGVRSARGAAKFGAKMTAGAVRTASNAVKFTAKAPKRIYSFATNKVYRQRVINQVRRAISSESRRRRAQVALKAGARILPFLLAGLLIMAPILAVVGQIPTISLKSDDKELNKVYLRVTELDAELTRELRAIPSSAAYQSVDQDYVRFFINGCPAPKSFQINTDADYILEYLDAKYNDYAYDKAIYGLFGGTNVKSELDEIHKSLYSYTTNVWTEEVVEPPSGKIGDPLNDIDPNDVWWYNANCIYSVFSVYLQEGRGYSKEESDEIISGALGKIQSESGLDPSQIEGFSTERGAFSASLTPRKWALFETEDNMDAYFWRYLKWFENNNRLNNSATSKFGRTLNAAPEEAAPDVYTWAYITAHRFWLGGISYAQWTGNKALQYMRFCKTNGLKWWTPEGALVFMFSDPAYGGEFDHIARVLDDGVSWHSTYGGVETVSAALGRAWLNRIEHPDQVCRMYYLNAERRFVSEQRAPGNWTVDYDYGRRILNKAAQVHTRPVAYSAAGIFRDSDDVFVETLDEDPGTGGEMPFCKTRKITHLDVYIEAKDLKELAQDLLTDSEADSIDALDSVGMYTLRQELSSPFVEDATWAVSRRWGKWCDQSNELEMHDGIDIRNKPGAEVLCVKTGVVNEISASICNIGGSSVRIKFGDNEVVYGNLTDLSVAVGETVPAGSHIGTVGSDAYLHLEYWRDGQSVNPLFYLEGYYLSTGAGASGVFTQAQQDIVDMALAAYANPGILDSGAYVGCAAFCAAVYRAAGYHDEGRNAINYWSDWQSSGGTSRSMIPVGALVVSAAGGEDGRLYGHVGIYIGNGEVIHYSGQVWKHSFENFLAFCGGEDAVTVNGGNVYIGYQGYVWPDGEVLGTYADETGC